MNARKRSFAAAQVLFMVPSVFFLAAVVVQNLGTLQHEPAHTAHQIVMWYGVRMWTLWLLLLTLPLVVLVTGCVILVPPFERRGTLLVGRAQHHSFAAIRGSWTLKLVAAMTVTAGAVLLIVIMHMAAT